MAETKTTILEFEVKYSDAIEQITKLNGLIQEQKEAQNALKEAVEEGNISEEEAAKQMVASQQIVKKYKDDVRSLEYQIKKQVQAQTENEGSLKALRGQLSDLTRQFDSLTREQREGEMGKALGRQIRVVHQELQRAEEDTGRFQRNVGNYGMKMVDAFSATAGSAASVINPVKNLTNGFKVMSKTPVIAILGLLANILTKIIDGLRSSEENTERMTIALAPLANTSKVVTRVMQTLGSALASAVEWLTKMADKLGLVTEAMKLNQELTAAEIKLEQDRRTAEVQNAKDRLAVAELRNKSIQSNIYNEKQRLDFVQQAQAIERGIMERNLALAREDVRIQEERSKQAGNSQEENNKLAQAYERLAQVQTEYYNSISRLDSREASLSKNVGNTSAEMSTLDKITQSLMESVDDLLDVSEDAIETTKSEDVFKAYEEIAARRTELAKQELANRITLAKQGSAEEAELRIQQLEVERSEQELKLQMAGGTYEQLLLLRQTYAQKEKEITDAVTENEKKQAEARRAANVGAATAIGQSLDNVSKVLAQTGKENAAMTRLAKVLGLAQVAINSGVAISNAVREASKKGVFGLPEIATLIATITGSMATAVSTINSAKFATGGVVRGAGTATSDSIPARLSNGESVINARSTSMFAPLLSAINQAGGGVSFGANGNAQGFDYLATAVAAGMRAANISVAVSEIESVQSRVSAIKGMSVIE